MTSLLTAEQFYERRDDWPEQGRWCELIAGRIEPLSPPDDRHGASVLAIARTLGDYAHRFRRGYACFETGLVVARRPDTVRVASVLFFSEGPAFEDFDRGYTERVPALVVDVASSDDRRRRIRGKVGELLGCGVPLVAVVDLAAELLHVCRQGQAVEQVPADGTFDADDVLPGLRAPVADWFRVPEW